MACPCYVVPTPKALPMSLAAYSYTRPLHSATQAPTLSAAPATPEALAGVTLHKAAGYARDAAERALSALMAGDSQGARLHLARAQRWEAYALTLTTKEA